MKRSLGAIVAMSLLSGCRSPAPPNDPFLYRSTVPPPGTIVPPAAGTPYYSAPAAVPGAAAPAGIAPVAPITPAPAPLAPAPAPTGPPSKYSPPGGFNYQSSLGPPAALPAITAAPVSASAAPPIDSTVVAAGSWQSPKDVRSDGSSAAQPDTQQPITKPRPDPSIVRIVEPTKPAVASGTDAAALSNVRIDAAQPAAAQPATLPSMVSTIPVAASIPTPTGPAATQTAGPPAIQELTDLPAVGTTSQDAAKSSASPPQQRSPATDRSAPTNIPAEQPGTTYGYDPDYKTLRGKLEYSAATGRWKLIYLPPEGPIDEYGGTVVLPDPAQLNGFEAGQFVTAQGTFTPPASGSGAPMFAIQRIKRQ